MHIGPVINFESGIRCFLDFGEILNSTALQISSKVCSIASMAQGTLEDVLNGLQQVAVLRGSKYRLAVALVGACHRTSTRNLKVLIICVVHLARILVVTGITLVVWTINLLVTLHDFIDGNALSCPDCITIPWGVFDKDC